MPAEFSIDGIDVGDRTSVLVVAGDLDLFTAPELRDRINAAIDDGSCNIVIDLTRATALDSTSLAVLISTLRRVRVREGDLIVVCDSPTILRMLDITGLDEVFEVLPSRGEALEAVGAGS